MNKPFKTIYQNDHFLVIEKRLESSFHNEDNSIGLFNLVKEDLKLSRLYAVHRLDRITTGLLLFAKTKDAAATISKQFQDQKVTKIYVALSDKKPKKKMGRIEGEIVKARSSQYKLIRSTKPNAKLTYQSYKEADNRFFFILEAITGKTHQLRVMLKSLGSPIIGDTMYSGSEHSEKVICLHSSILSFSYEGERYVFLSEPEFKIPIDLHALAEKLADNEIPKININHILNK
jgi:tRNA pseudouridine32 synthase / 23S rRNA pseudouridine746 synthase